MPARPQRRRLRCQQLSDLPKTQARPDFQRCHGVSPSPNSVFHESNSMITLDYSILLIGDKPALLDYSRAILDEVRAEIDKSTDKINGKVQRAEQMKVHTMFVIGKRDMEANASVSASTAREISAPNRARKPSRRF